MSSPSPIEALGQLLAEVSTANHQQMEAMQSQIAQQSQILRPLTKRARAGTPTAARPTLAAVGMHRMAETEDPQNFMDMFEATAKACEWPEEEWAVRLLPLLAGEAQRAALSLPPASRVSYRDMRRAVLDRTGGSKEDHRRQFRTMRLGQEERPFALGQQLRDATTRWLQPGQVGEVIEQIILEQFLEAIPDVSLDPLPSAPRRGSGSSLGGGPPVRPPGKRERGEGHSRARSLSTLCFPRKRHVECLGRCAGGVGGSDTCSGSVQPWRCSRRSDRGGATRIYHLNLLQGWREAEPVSMVTAIAECEELGPEVPSSPRPFPLRCDNHLTASQKADVANLQQHFADVFSPLPGRTNLTQHHIETSPGVMRLMDRVLRPHAAYAAAYLDDVIIQGNNWAGNMQRAVCGLLGIVTVVLDLISLYVGLRDHIDISFVFLTVQSKHKNPSTKSKSQLSGEELLNREPSLLDG
ncbi:uncharacterized protein LOC133652731 [Entelurus aequoreus]|uniref:uncharacterized protein LOC133652731 n=1 Tax=Entelurus aequoreus TaxID=161455 RepID=UPI002B1D234F|nr:uncharacterized protein LOC133652731 [Entelurus aequoreus]